jgi:hypothetical protein
MNIEIIALIIALLSLAAGSLRLIISYKDYRKKHDANPFQLSYKIKIFALITLVIIPAGGLGYNFIKNRTLSHELTEKTTKLESTAEELQKRTIQLRQKTTRIALLLPIDESKSTSAYDDGERQALGLIQLIKRKNEDAIGKYSFAIHNHGMNESEAESIVISELQRGTEYILCTMSLIGEHLSKKFGSLVKEHSIQGLNPKLIITVASSPAIVTSKDTVFRFYIRSYEESRILAKSCFDNTSLRAATAIAVNDPYGKGAVDQFKKEWEHLGGSYTTGVFFQPECEETEIINTLKEKLLTKPLSVREIIFIAHYGGGLDKVINAIYKLNLDPLIVATSTLSIENWQKPIKEALDSLSWITCVPALNGQGMKLYEGDVVQDFVYYTLDRLIAVDERCQNTGESFQKVWNVIKEPKRLIYIINDEGDSEFGMNIDLSHLK